MALEHSHTQRDILFPAYNIAENDSIFTHQINLLWKFFRYDVFPNATRQPDKDIYLNFMTAEPYITCLAAIKSAVKFAATEMRLDDSSNLSSITVDNIQNFLATLQRIDHRANRNTIIYLNDTYLMNELGYTTFLSALLNHLNPVIIQTDQQKEVLLAIATREQELKRNPKIYSIALWHNEMRMRQQPNLIPIQAGIRSYQTEPVTIQAVNPATGNYTISLPDVKLLGILFEGRTIIQAQNALEKYFSPEDIQTILSVLATLGIGRVRTQQEATIQQEQNQNVSQPTEQGNSFVERVLNSDSPKTEEPQDRIASTDNPLRRHTTHASAAPQKRSRTTPSETNLQRQL